MGNGFGQGVEGGCLSLTGLQGSSLFWRDQPSRLLSLIRVLVAPSKSCLIPYLSMGTLNILH